MADLKLKQNFAKILKGDTVTQVREISGNPSHEMGGEKHKKAIYPSLNKKYSNNCKRELWYKVKYSPLPSVWSYCFNSKDEFIQKYHWVSW